MHGHSGISPDTEVRFLHPHKADAHMKEDTRTIESRVADEVLQRPMTVKIGGKDYDVAPPTLATLILVSAEIARMPSEKIDMKDMIYGTIARAEEYRPVADAIAVLILGAKGLKGTRKRLRSRYFGLVREEVEEPVDLKAELSELILNECSPHDLNMMLVDLLKRMQLGDFFGLTVSLTEINLLRRTKETVTTASGRQSQGPQRHTD